MDPVCGLPMRLLGVQREYDMNTADDQYTVLQLNLADRLRHQSLVRGVYVTRLQRASEGSSQSTRSRGDNVVQGSGVWLEDGQRNLVMLCYGPVHSENYRLRFGREIRPAKGPLHSLNAHNGPVNHFRHDDRSVSRRSHSAVYARG
jgi:hypothetical protein